MNLLRNTNNNIKETQKSAIYQFLCINYEKCYIGQTRRNIRIMLKE